MPTRALLSEDSSLIALSILLSATVSLALLLILITVMVVILRVISRHQNIFRNLIEFSSAQQYSILGADTCNLVPTRSCLIKSYELEQVISGSGMPSTTLVPNKLLTHYSVEELKKFTDNFADEHVVGRGGSGTVFKGILGCGMQIAVKKLNTAQAWSQEVFCAEVAAISRTHHQHVVRLMGWCLENGCLVYEYVPNGTLAAHLRRQGGVQNYKSMSWDTRRKIAIQCAHALMYLHHFCTPSIVHRDIKSGNILLDNDYDAKIADFGLARLIENTHMTTNPGGTFGYMSPRHVFTTKATTKSDIYSFGVVLLELITGLPAVLPLKDGISSLVSLVISSLKQNPHINFLDPYIEDTINMKEFSFMIMAALGCLNDEAVNRPTMLQVLQLLEHGIWYPSHILQAYDQHIILNLSNLSHMNEGSSTAGHFLSSSQNGYQLSSSYNDYFENAEPPLRSIELSKTIPTIELAKVEHNGSSYDDAFSLLSSLTFSRMGSSYEGVELQQANVRLFDHPLLSDGNHLVSGHHYTTSEQDYNYANGDAKGICFEDSRKFCQKGFDAQATTNPTSSTIDNIIPDPIWNIASIQGWNQACTTRE